MCSRWNIWLSGVKAEIFRKNLFTFYVLRVSVFILHQKGSWSQNIRCLVLWEKCNINMWEIQNVFQWIKSLITMLILQKSLLHEGKMSHLIIQLIGLSYCRHVIVRDNSFSLCRFKHEVYHVSDLLLKRSVRINTCTHW